MAGFDLSIFENKRLHLESKLSKISEIALSLGIDKTVLAIQKSITELNDDTFKIVVVGEFSRGKSTFINALLGKKILPASTKPTTTILNKIYFSESPKYRMVFRDKKENYRDITEEEFKKIIAPKEPIIGDEQSEYDYQNNLRKISDIAFAEIGYPTKICKGGVEIVDTPGTNDLDAAREEITYKFIPESDVAIVLLSACQILTESEMSFIKDRIIKSDIQKIYYVINFKDRMQEKANETKVLEYARKHLESVSSNPRIFMVSAKGALNYRRAHNNEDVKGVIPNTIESTGFIELEENISEFLTNERGSVKLSKFIERGIRISTELKNSSIAISLGTLNIGLDELEQKIKKLRPEVQRVKTICNDSISGLRSILMSSGLETQGELRKGLERIANSAGSTVRNYQGTLSNEEIAKAIENVVAPMQTEIQSRISKKQQDLISDEVERVNRKLGYEWEAINNSIIDELTFQSVDKSLDLENLQSVDEDMSYIKSGAGALGIVAFVGAIHLAVFALPVAFFGGKYIFSYFQNKKRERILEKAREQVDSRYRDIIPELIKSFDEQWKNSLSTVINNLKTELDRKYVGIEQQLNSILNDRSSEKMKVDEIRKDLLKQDKLLGDIINDLNGLLAG
ncbi:dynamin family protein [Clostridium estertheticum]|uniref:Dynamin family protein n=1 Tax=Clostridium estertheticum subsp. estertheticum TaxID=1552 RepID=A0A1J0GF49_9CLOT|nr:dynamin family protein [Clostridium estertheticum]APC40004.1 hypothetical protein A7L45_07960 [Clostridium estertheticum subsp. estertheticum]MBU3072495.1 dynamin family protein [Clostridium estertheticum]MBU3162588.1 dynamin family protein [Clostridium estertheticum]MBZ9618226.1 dynamin family protein [Clostridium estertheticum subsp. laramiense]WAG73874.1 dynamin family protein [Clostridium estertheticum]